MQDMENEVSVFRPEAIRRHQGGRGKTVLPLFGKPRARSAVLLCVGLFCAALTFAAFTEVPVYVRGTAVPDGTPDAQGNVSAVAIFPPDSLAKLKVGQRAFVEPGGGGAVGVGEVTSLSSRLTGRDELEGRPKASVETDVPAGPVVVARARLAWASAPGSPRPAGTPRPVWVEIGSRRLGSLLRAD